MANRSAKVRFRVTILGRDSLHEITETMLGAASMGDGCENDLTLHDFHQILPGRRFFSQFPKPSMAKFLFHTLSELVRFAQKTTGPGWLRAFAFVIHVMSVPERAKGAQFDFLS